MSTSLLELTAPTSAQAWAEICGFASLREASAVAGGQGRKALDALSSPGKMPCHSYGLPAAECNVGSRLREASTDENPTVCGSCYALKGNYVWKDVSAAQYRRLESLSHPRWADAMVCLIGWASRDSRVFRWHDSGDLQSVEHLSKIVEIADRLPWIQFWIPTREAGILRVWMREHGAFPVNLTVRQSSALVGHFANPNRASDGRTFSSVAFKGQGIPAGLWACAAYKQDGQCGDCRACWSQEVPVVVYPLH